MATAFKNLFQRRGSEPNRPGANGSELSDGPETAPAWLKGGVFKPNRQVGKTLPIAWDGTAGSGGGGRGGSPSPGQSPEAQAVVPAGGKTGHKLRSTLELPEGQVQIMVDPEAARIWGAIREVSEALIEKALLCGEAELVGKFRQELAVLQIRNPGLLHSDALCSLLNELAHVDLLGLSRQRAVLALQKILLTMQELSQRSEYQYAAEGVDPAGVRGLPSSSLPDLTIYIQDYKAMAHEAQAKARTATKRAEEAEAALRNATLAPPPSGDSTPKPTQKTLTPAQQKSHQKAIGAMDDNIRRAELQLSDLEEELADKTRRYQDLIAKIAATKQSIEEIDALLKASTKENETKLRQLLQKQNAGALQLGLDSAAVVGTGGTTARGKGGGAQAGHVSGGPSAHDGGANAEKSKPSKMLGKMLPPDDPTLVAYLAENRRMMEDAAAKAVVEFVTNLLGLNGLVGEIEDSEEWKAAMGGRAIENGEEGDDDEEEEEDSDEDDDGSFDYDDDALDEEMNSVLGALDELDWDEDDEDEDAAADATMVDPETGKTINRVLAGVLGEIEGSPVAVRTRRGGIGRRGVNSGREVRRALFRNKLAIKGEY